MNIFSTVFWLSFSVLGIISYFYPVSDFLMFFLFCSYVVIFLLCKLVSFLLSLIL